MTITSPPAQPATVILRTQIAYLANDQVTRPVGVRVVEPPPDTRQALRGNLYAVVELPGETPEQEAFAERLLSAIQRTYYTVKGTQSHVLREALREAQRSLDAYNETSGGEPIRAAIVITAILGKRVLVISNGLGLALVTASEHVDVYPPYTPAAPAQEATEPPGGWEIYRQEMDAGGALFIGGRRWLEGLTLRELASTVAYLTEENCTEAAAALLEQADQPALPGVLIVLTPAQAIPIPVVSGGLPPALRRARVGGLPTSLNATPPVYGPPLLSPAPRPPLDRPATELGGNGHEPPASAAAPPTPVAEPVRSAGWAGLMATAQAGLARTKSFFTSLFPDQRRAEPGTVSPIAPQPAPARVESTSEVRPAATPLPPPTRTTGSRARLFVLLAALILVLVPVVVAARQWQVGANNRADAELLLDLAEARLASAQEAFDAGDKVGSRALLAEAQGHVDQARTLLVTRSPRADALAVEIQRELNEVLQIQPLYGLVEPLVRFPSDAQPHRLLVVDQDIYVLDTGRQLVQHFRIDPESNTVPDQAGDVVVRQGDQVDGVEVGRLVAMSWQSPLPGIEDKPTLLMLDRNNNLFKYDARVEGIARINVADTGSLVTPSQIYAYSGRLYVLDEGANQIFRYNPADYSQAPEPWFATQTPINLSGVQAMAIDGDIWMLFANGQVLRYQQGVQASFALENSVPLPSEPADLAIGSQSDSLLYVADRSESRILVFDKSGVFQRQLQAAEGDPLRGLSGLYVDEVAETIYILTRSGLYLHALPE